MSFDFLIKFNEKKNRKELLITDTKDILDRIMNAASHHSENPLHREELKNAIEKMVELKEHLKHDQSNPSQPHTLPSRSNQRSNPSLAKSVAVPTLGQNDRKPSGRRRSTMP